MNRKIKTAALLLVLFLFVLLNFFGRPGAEPDGGSAGEPEQGTRDDTPAPLPARDPFPSPQKTIGLIQTGDFTVRFRASGGYFYRYRDGAWNFVYLKGVNIGLTEPTTVMENYNTGYETYRDWFEKIAGMGANTVRAFTVMNPHFYNALYDYNQIHADDPLYLLQGIWFNETYMTAIGNAFDGKQTIVQAFRRAIYETVNLLHGNSDYTHYGEFRPAVYDKDLSPYVAGYILGLEWHYDFINQTNSQNKDKTSYEGEYLYTAEGASPFEVFLAQMGDDLIAYESMMYGFQTPVAFLNWAPTDPLEHSNEPFTVEHSATLNTETILPTLRYYAGLFAAYDIYPYYPEFLNYQAEYLAFTDASGKSNPYRAYLRELRAFHSVPVILAEVGLPSSRAIAHASAMGYHQGGITEEQQGEYVGAMLEDIAKEGYAGSMIFSWQDEWFKNTWNAVSYSPADPSLRTPNLASAEQSYGIVAFDPATVYADGDDAEWRGLTPVCSENGILLYARYDAGYLHLLLRAGEGTALREQTVYLPIRTVGLGSRSAREQGLTFGENADFILVLDGEENTRVLTDAYYDLFHYTYAKQKSVFEEDDRYSTKNTGLYNPIYTFYSNAFTLPETGVAVEPRYTESGLLSFGINNPDADGYDSLADFYIEGSLAEISIPWCLLNVANAAEKRAIDDFHVKNKITFRKIADIKVGVAVPGKTAPLFSIGYTGLTEIVYRERLKKSYAILRDVLTGLME